MKPAFRTFRAVDRAADERGRKGYGCEADARSGTVRERMTLLVQYRAALMEHYGVAGKQTDRRCRALGGGGRGAEA